MISNYVLSKTKLSNSGYKAMKPYIDIVDPIKANSMTEAWTTRQSATPGLKNGENIWEVPVGKRLETT